MLKERVEKENNVKCIYESSNILASTFDKGTNDLTIIFKNGGQYKYNSVSDTDYMRFETADSQGKIMNSKIKAYSFSKMDNVDTNKILDRIKLIKSGEISAIKNDIISFLKEIIENNDKTNELDDKNLIYAEKLFKQYRELI